MHSLAVALLLTSSAFAAGTNNSNEQTLKGVDDERRRVFSKSQWGKHPKPEYAPPSGTNCNFNTDCRQIGYYCYTAQPFNICKTGQAVGSLCSTNSDCGTQGYKPLTCKCGVCANTPSPSPSPSGCKTSDDCPKIGDFCHGQYSATNGVCQPGSQLGSMCNTNAQCGYIGNRPVSCDYGICIDTGAGSSYGRRLSLPSVDAPQPEDDVEERRRANVVQFAPPKGCNCQTSADCDTWNTGKYCFTTGLSFNCCKNQNPLGSLCGGSSECGGYSCVFGVCKATGRRLAEAEDSS